jgi:hypothetical protein
MREDIFFGGGPFTSALREYGLCVVAKLHENGRIFIAWILEALQVGREERKGGVNQLNV